MLKINTITQLWLFFVMAISINLLNIKILILLFILLIMLLAIIKTNSFLPGLKRFKWFFLVLLTIFAFNTPGEHIASWPFSMSPTYEGIVAGLTQMLRVMLMLASLNLILACNSRQQLVCGFYFILSPLKYFGFEVERFAARLWLTLHYVELQDKAHNQQDFMQQLNNLASQNRLETNQDVNITFTLPQFCFLDVALFAILLIGVFLYMFKVFS